VEDGMSADAESEADALIADYKRALLGEIELAASDLDEIEDHLRALANDLRERGMPHVAAVREACRRLGDPHAVAREHARVRPAFGAQLSRLRAFGAVALTLPILISSAMRIFPSAGIVSHIGIQILLGGVVALALALGLNWARPIVVGGIACFTLQVAADYFMWPGGNPFWLVCYPAILVLVAPWRIRELTPSGWALACNVWAFTAAAYALELGVNGHPVATAALPALGLAIIATCGVVLRARWSAVISAATGVALALTLGELAPLTVRFRFPWFSELTQAFILLLIGSGVVAAAGAALLAWRTSRSTFGTLQHAIE
jgi:hypothetical protein